MSATNERLCNRLILRHASDVAGIPQSAADFAHVLRGRGLEPAEAAARQGIAQLATLGYLARAEATAADEPLYKITASGLRQILRQVKAEELDPMVWG